MDLTIHEAFARHSALAVCPIDIRTSEHGPFRSPDRSVADQQSAAIFQQPPERVGYGNGCDR